MWSDRGSFAIPGSLEPVLCLGVGVRGSGLRVWGLGFGVSGLGFGLGFGLGCRFLGRLNWHLF